MKACFLFYSFFLVCVQKVAHFLQSISQKGRKKEDFLTAATSCVLDGGEEQKESFFAPLIKSYFSLQVLYYYLFG